MIVGAQKSGTTTLFDILDRHPSLVGCRKKEPHFFSTSENWREALPEYESLFDRKEGALYFEASTSYTFFALENRRVWDDIFEYNPRAKIIYVVRTPLDRVVSHYMHAYERGYTDLPIEEAVTEASPFVEVTRYFTQIRPYIERFGRSSVLILDFDDLFGDPASEIGRVVDFIGVSYDPVSAYVDLHANRSLGGQQLHHRFDRLNLPQRVVRKLVPWLWRRITDNSARAFSARPELSLAKRRAILDTLAREIDQLERLLDKDLSKWRQLTGSSLSCS